MRNLEARKKAEELVNQMTVEEMASQLKYDAPAIKHLGIPSYNWWNEALHGVARAGTATVFPQAIALAAIFDAKIIGKIANVIAVEGRAKYNMQVQEGDRDIYKGLTFWSPNLNIFRDPHWGRGHETYGEDPYLTSRLGVAYIKGLQGSGKYLKVAACAKHFALHSGPENLRHSFDAIATPKDMVETYLPAFEAAVVESQVEAVMGAYNRTNGEPCCGSKTLLIDILRNQWGFKGHVVSDCWAIKDFHTNHMVTSTPAQSAALALKNGCDINCGNTYLHMLMALKQGLVTEKDIKESAIRAFTTRYKLGLFDETCLFNAISYEDNDSNKHNELSLEASRKSIVMLKNNGILPLNPVKVKKIGVIGPTANSRKVLEGNYCGTASRYITNLEGIQAAVGLGTRVFYSEGCHLYKDRISGLSMAKDRIAEAVAIAKISDVVILCLGLDATMEGEEGDTGNSFAAGDKNNLLLSDSQMVLLEKVIETGKPVIVVINGGSALDLSFAQEYSDGILLCWYSGSQGGIALAEVIFGKCCPSGKLPVTFYYDTDLPAFTDYSMKNRTYRYLKNSPLYPFGYGLSYTDFVYTDLKMEESQLKAGDKIRGRVTVTNKGFYDGDEIIQVYLKNHLEENIQNTKNLVYEGILNIENQPIYSLCGFQRISLKAGSSMVVSFEVDNKSLYTVFEDGSKGVMAGGYSLYVGGAQPDSRSRELLEKETLVCSLCIKDRKMSDKSV